MLKIFENNTQSKVVWSGLDAWQTQTPTSHAEPEPEPEPAPSPVHPLDAIGSPASKTLNSLAFCGAPGGVGKTSLAINVAFELASASKKVALIDLDIDHPNLMTALCQQSLTAGLSGAHRLISQGRFNADDLDRLTMVLNFDGVRLWVLPGLAKPAEPEARVDFASSIVTLLEAFSESFDWVVFDLPSSIQADQFVQQCLGLADFAFAVCGGEPTQIQRYLWSQPNLKTGLANAPQVIVNGVRDAVIGSDSKRQIADTLEQAAQAEVVAFVPHDQAGFDAALLEGLPLQLVKKGSGARHALSMFVRQGLLGQRASLDWRLLRG